MSLQAKRTVKKTSFTKNAGFDISDRKDYNCYIDEQGSCIRDNIAGWSSLEARRAHNPKVIGSNPIPATTKKAVAQ